jgi:Ca-activated chloride channel homolog
VVIPGFGTFTLSDFAEPSWLWFALFPAIVVGAYLGARIQSRRRLRAFTGDRPATPRRRRHLPLIAVAAALVALTIALAQPERDVQTPHNSAVVMLVVDVSKSMDSNDVAPSRLQAAEHAATDFADHLAPGINLGLVTFSGNANVLVSPTPKHDATVTALGMLHTAERTATGQGLQSALGAIDTLNSLFSQAGSTPPPARIVLISDGKETVPENLDAPTGAYTAARLAGQRQIPISTITIGTATGHVIAENQRVDVPVEGDSMRRIAELSGGQSYDATDAAQLSSSYDGVRDAIGYRTELLPDATAWLRLSALLAAVGAVGGLLLNRRLPA